MILSLCNAYDVDATFKFDLFKLSILLRIHTRTQQVKLHIVVRNHTTYPVHHFYFRPFYLLKIL